MSTKPRTSLKTLLPGFRHLICWLRYRNILNFGCQSLHVCQIELDNVVDLRLVHRLLADVDKQRTRKRVVSSGDNVFRTRQYRLLNFVLCPLNRNCFHASAVRSEVGVRDVTEGELVTFNTLDQHIVIFTGRVITAACFRFPADCLGEVIESSRVGSGTKQHYFFVGPFRTNLVPVCDPSLRPWFPDLLQLVHGHRSYPIVLRVNDHCDGVKSDGQLNELNTVRFSLGHFFREYRPGRIRHIDLAAHKFLEPAAGPGDTHGNVYSTAFFFLKLLRHRFGDRENGAGTIDLNYCGLAGSGPAAASAAGHSDSDEGQSCEHSYPLNGFKRGHSVLLTIRIMVGGACYIHLNSI